MLVVIRRPDCKLDKFIFEALLFSWIGGRPNTTAGLAERFLKRKLRGSIPQYALYENVSSFPSGFRRFGEHECVVTLLDSLQCACHNTCKMRFASEMIRPVKIPVPAIRRARVPEQAGWWPRLL